jgi:hypothetical protein
MAAHTSKSNLFKGTMMLTPQETELLQNFLSQLTQINGVTKDPQAERLIAEALARQPDAGYLLVQRTLLQDQALTVAQTQIAELQSQRNQYSGLRNESNFFDSSNSWGNSAGNSVNNSQRSTSASLPATTSPMQRYDTTPQYQPTAATRPGFFSGGSTGFLGNMAATAAGVAGGAFLFQGIESLMGHHGGGLFGQHHATTPSESDANHFLGGQDNQSSREESSDMQHVSSGDSDQASDDVGTNDDLGSDDDISSI